jgi:hypothetical protein
MIKMYEPAFSTGPHYFVLSSSYIKQGNSGLKWFIEGPFDLPDKAVQGHTDISKQMGTSSLRSAIKAKRYNEIEVPLWKKALGLW